MRKILFYPSVYKLRKRVKINRAVPYVIPVAYLIGKVNIPGIASIVIRPHEVKLHFIVIGSL